MVIEYKDVQLRQDDRPVLRGVTFTLDGGELLYVTGEVGSGKSSLLKSMYGELPIWEGKATVLGIDMIRLRPRKFPRLRRQVGIIFQDFQLLRDRTVEANLDFVLRATGWSKKEERRRRIGEVLSLVGMEGHESNMPYELSGGEQQCVCIARAMLNEPKLIIADEPTANLDEESSLHVMSLLDGIRQKGTAIVLSTHNARLPGLFPGRVMRTEDGRLRETETGEQPKEELKEGEEER